MLGTSGSGLKDNIVNVFGPKLVAHIMPIDLPGITYTTRKRVEKSFGCVQLRICSLPSVRHHLWLTPHPRPDPPQRERFRVAARQGDWPQYRRQAIPLHQQPPGGPLQDRQGMATVASAGLRA